MYPKGAYQIQFTQDAAGIPVGTCDATSITNLDTDYQNATNQGNYAKCGDSDKTDRHRVHLGFLGDSYIISQMNAPSDTECGLDLTSTTTECYGGSINLAKESAYGIVHVGENLSAGAYTLKLQDIEAPLGSGQDSAASIAIYDSTGTLLKEDKFYPGQSSYTWTAPDGSKVRIRVYKTNPGYYAYAKWAEMAVYSSEFTMNDGQQLNTDNQNWNVRLVWRNKDPTYTSKSADALKKVILYDSTAGQTTSNYLSSGDTYNIIQSPIAYQVQFGGITLGSADYDTLSMYVTYYPTSTFAVQTNFDASCTGTGSDTEYLAGNFMELHSNVRGGFQLSGTDTFQVQDFYIWLGNNTNTTDFDLITVTEGDVIFQKPVGSCFYTMPASIQYVAGDATSDDTPVTYTPHTNFSTDGFALITFQEAASTSSGIVDSFSFPIYRDDADNKDKFLLTTTATREIFYTGVPTPYVDSLMAIGTTTAEEGYYS
ncbi:MAG: hypothetical protein NTY73_00805, partial [Candidatus Micrarchaeota archaeon]|nr:hypothetical protein [Candidatus Micrarchaeota archaeon]